LLFRLYAESEIKVPKPIIANHELAAGFMAIGYARASGKMGVAMSIGGPGAAYMIGAGVTAKIDDVPVLFITGNIPPESFGLGEFQDASDFGTNDSAIFKEAVGTSMVCNKPDDLQDIIYKIRQCYKELKSIHVQIPVNIQKAVYPFSVQEEINDIKNLYLPELDFRQKTKIIFLIGQKALEVIDGNLLYKVAKRNSFAIVTDMKSRGILSETEKECLGYIGFNSDIRALEVFNHQSPLAVEKIFTIGVSEKLIRQYINTDQIEVCKIEPQVFNNWSSKLTSNQNIVNERIEWLEEVNKLIPPQANSVLIHNKL
jgi:acetolactate synthase-1/2/3 large subunit